MISDAHGYPELILNAFRHGGFEPGRDAFVFAGDLLDRGPDAQRCIDLVDRYASEVLLGNHDLAVLFGFFVFPQNPESSGFRSFLLKKVQAARPWKAATSVDGVLITHAGVSEEYGLVFRSECGSDPDRLAERLNATLGSLVERAGELTGWFNDRLLGDSGPFWFRPAPCTHLMPLRDCQQVVGHTLPLALLEAFGFHMIDPSPWDGVVDTKRYRYAVIEGGNVRVEDGSLRGRGTRRLPKSEVPAA